MPTQAAVTDQREILTAILAGAVGRTKAATKTHCEISIDKMPIPIDISSITWAPLLTNDGGQPPAPALDVQSFPDSERAACPWAS